MSGRTRTRESGFTLLELMVTATILSIVVYMTLDSLVQQQKTSVVTEKVVEVQQNVRAIGSLLEREIRMAGFMVPDAVGVCGLDATTAPDELYVSDTAPIVPDDERAGTLGSRLSTALSAPIGGGGISVTVDSTDLDDDGSFFYDNDGDGTPDSDFLVGGGFILADAANPERGSVCGVVRGTSATNVTGLIVAGDLDAHNSATHSDEDLMVVPAVRYWIDTSSAQGRLERNGDLLTNGVDDFQVSYFYDDDGDGEIDAPVDETPGTAAGSVYDANDWDNSILREVRFSIVVRTRDDDPDFQEGEFEANENRVAVAGKDGFRRREIEATVRPRNIAAPGAI